MRVGVVCGGVCDDVDADGAAGAAAPRGPCAFVGLEFTSARGGNAIQHGLVCQSVNQVGTSSRTHVRNDKA